MGNHWVSTICGMGSYSAVGSDTLFTACITPSGSEYTTAVCVAGEKATIVGSNSVVAACATPKDGEWVSTECVSGSDAELGSNTGISDCRDAAAYSLTNGPHYNCEKCAAGAPKEMGTDTGVCPCAEPSSTQFTTAVCAG